MEYLVVKYGKISKPIKEQAKSKFIWEYDPNLPISEYFKSIYDAMQIADDANFPWQTEQILYQTCREMGKWGIYKDECKDWLNKKYVDQTWDNFNPFS